MSVPPNPWHHREVLFAPVRSGGTAKTGKNASKTTKTVASDNQYVHTAAGGTPGVVDTRMRRAAMSEDAVNATSDNIVIIILRIMIVIGIAAWLAPWLMNPGFAVGVVTGSLLVTMISRYIKRHQNDIN